MPTRMSGTLTALRSDVPTNGGKSDDDTSGVITGTTKGNLMKKLLRRLLLWALQPELTAQAATVARLKLVDENVQNVRHFDGPRLDKLEQRVNSLAPLVEEWHAYGPMRWCEDTKKELGTELKYLKDHTDALRNHRERHDVRLQKIESILRVMGRL